MTLKIKVFLHVFSGIYNEDGPYVAYIDVKKVGALSVCQTAPTLELGGGMKFKKKFLRAAIS